MRTHKIMKWLLCVCLTLFLVLTLAACGGKTDEPDTPPEVDTEEPQAPEPVQEPETEPEPPIPFTDVPEDASYYDTVVWAYENGIVSDGATFEPDSACTRAQVITFLWRATGSPEPQTAENPFSDISSSDWYYKPILWAYENNIVTGTAFNPDNSCTNGEILTFLWRAEGKPAAAVYNSTVALAASSEYYARPVAWADNNGMFDGMDSAFDPAAPCRRADIVTYLYWATEQWAFTEEDRIVQAEYEQIVNSELPAETLGSGLLYADYLDIDGDGKVELLTLVRDFDEGEFTATVYANIEGHAGKSCEEIFNGMFGGRNAQFSLCKADNLLYFRYCGYGTTGDSYQFYKIEKEAVTLENALVGDDKQYNEDTITYNEHTDLGKDIAEDEFNAILQKYTDKKELFTRSYSDFEVSDRGIVPSPAEYWKANRDLIYAAVLEGDFSYFAGDYEGIDSWGDGNASASLDKNGSLTNYHYNWDYTTKEPVSIIVTESGSIYCVIEPRRVDDEDGSVYGEYLIIYPYSVEYDTDEIKYFGKQYGTDEVRIIYSSFEGFSGDSYQLHKVY